MNINTNILLVASSRNANKLFDSLQLTSSCKMIKQKWNFSLTKLFAPIDEILFTTSFTQNYNITLIKRLVFLCKMLLKRPRLVIQTLFFAKTFNIVCENNCDEHCLAIDSKMIVWYSTSAAKQGFPWAYDSFLNSLKFIRDKSIDLMVFGLEINKEVLLAETGTSETRIPVKNFTLPSGDVKTSFSEILSWKNTTLQMVTDAEIYHGSILSKSGQVLLQDLDLNFNNFPERMTPNSLWFKESNLDEIEDLTDYFS